MHKSTNDKTAFYDALAETAASPLVSAMKQYTQHSGYSIFCHCHDVAIMSFHIAEALRMKVDAIAIAHGAMLHDFYLYQHDLHDVAHLVTHPSVAAHNAGKVFHLSAKEENIIESHMWPLTIGKLPKSREALLVSIADKCCATREMLRGHKRARRAV